MPFAYIQFVEKPDWERPDRPGIGRPEHPIAPGGPDRPGFPERPGQGLPGFPDRPGHLPSYGGRPVDPGYGVEAPGEGGGGGAGQLPIWPVAPDQGLPPVPGHPMPPVDPPPGTVWPPLPPSVPEGKVIALVAISGIGYRYTVLTVPPPKPDQGLPPGERPGVPPRPQPQPPEVNPTLRR